MAIALSGTPVLSNSGGSTATSMTATLASTTVGVLNIVAVSANTTGTGTDPAQSMPAGWTAVPSATSGKTGTPYHRLSLFYRFYQAGDTNPTVTIAALGNIECACVAYSGVDSTTPFVTGEVLAQTQGASSTSWSTGSITTAALRWIISVFGNRTNGTWSALTDTQRLTGIVASSANIAFEDTNGTVAAGTITARTATFSAATSVGNTVILALNPASSALAASGTAALSLTASGGWTEPGTAALTLTASGAWTEPGTGGLSLTATAAATAPATATAALSLTATAGGPSASGTAALSLTASSSAPTAAATASAALSLTASGPGRAATTGTASITLTASGTTVTLLATWLSRTPLYVAHRGGDNDWVEMTRDAYTHAIANGATAINIDAVKCSTGEFVASHDLTTGRVFGTNLTIGSSTWSSLSGLTTTSGGFAIEKVADLLAAFPNVVVFVENKGNSSDDSAFLDMLDAAGGPARIVVKQYYTASTVSTDAHARGYTTWGYYFAGDVGNLASTQSRWDLLGLDYTDTSGTDWTNFLATGKVVLGHVIPSAAGASQAFSEGANGIMTGKVLGVIPNNAASGTASLTLAASGTGKAAATGPAALSLVASGAGSAASTGSAALTLAASGSAAAPATGSASLSLTATAAAGTTGTAVLTLTAAASAQARATGAAALSLAGAGGGPSVSGSGSLNLTGATATAAQVTATAALSFIAQAAGSGTPSGSAALTLTGTGSAAAPVTGTASLTLAAGGNVQARASGTASFTFTASGVTGGGSPASGTAALQLNASGAGGVSASGSAAMALAAAGSVQSAASGAAGLALIGTATYVVPVAGGAVITITAAAAPAVQATGSALLTLTAAGAAISGTAGQDIIFTAALGPQTYRFTAALAARSERFTAPLATQSHRFTAALGGQP